MAEESRRKPTLLITGAGGMIAPTLAGALKDAFTMRLTDVVEVQTEHEFLQADLADSSAVGRVMEGVDAVIHLGALTWDMDVHTRMIPSNIVGTYNVFESARIAG
ncbi:MAG: NAD-dependent epimerase/dehydratase family protein, partial [Spirochaetales bacterium]